MILSGYRCFIRMHPFTTFCSGVFKEIQYRLEVYNPASSTLLKRKVTPDPSNVANVQMIEMCECAKCVESTLVWCVNN